jgi:four helix bundle protein
MAMLGESCEEQGIGIREQEAGFGESFKDLLVWQRAVRMTVSVYKFTASFPSSEHFGLTNQLRRGPVSVASNIAEGCGGSSTGEYRHFLDMVRGSNCEVQTQLLISEELGFGIEEQRTLANGL